MKKTLIIAIIASLTGGAAYAIGYKCTQCNGTGWKGNDRCFYCGGDGITGN